MHTLRFIGKRLALMVPTLLGISILTFFISNSIPGDPARLIAGQYAAPDVVAALRHKLGLDQPLYIQYFRYMGRLLHGDLGTSLYSQQSVITDLKQYFPATLELTLFSLLITVVVGIPLGILSAHKRDKWQDQISRVFSLVGIAMPSFWLGILFLLLFYLRWGILPGGGRLGDGMAPPTHITGMYTVDALLTGNWPDFFSALIHLILPGVTLAIVTIGMITRMTRSSMLEVLQSDYIRTAYAKGVSERRMLYGHALRNGITPVFTLLGMIFGNSLGGSVLVETVYGWPGIGRYAVNAISYLDFSAIMGVTLLIALLFIVINLIVDVFYHVIDPRLSYDA